MSGFFWDHEPCPLEDCDGELQQQDRFNVLCLECGAVFGHLKDETDHILTDDSARTVHTKPRVMTDGGTCSDETVQCVECGSDLTDPKNAGDPDINGEWVCVRPVCRRMHQAPLTVGRHIIRTEDPDTDASSGGSDQ